MSKKKKKDKAPKYRPFDPKQIFGPGDMFGQGAAALDLAAYIAAKEEDTTTLVNVAKQWIVMAASILSVEEEVEVQKQSKIKFGFCVEEGEEE